MRLSRGQLARWPEGEGGLVPGFLPRPVGQGPQVHGRHLLRPVRSPSGMSEGGSADPQPHRRRLRARCARSFRHPESGAEGQLSGWRPDRAVACLLAVGKRTDRRTRQQASGFPTGPAPRTARRTMECGRLDGLRGAQSFWADPSLLHRPVPQMRCKALDDKRGSGREIVKFGGFRVYGDFLLGTDLLPDLEGFRLWEIRTLSP